ncbi:MAG: glycosyl hydrolase family 18 protein [Fimbriimonadaceae bacterium]
MTATFASLLAALATSVDPVPAEPRVHHSAWLVFWNPASLERFEAQAHRIGEIKPEWIGVDADGMPFRREHGAPEAKRRFWEVVRRHGVTALAMVSNFASEAGGFDAKRVQRMLADAETRRRHIEALVAIVREDGFAGIDLDIESLEAGDRDRFSAYVEELAAALHRHRLRLTVTVHPKESDEGTWGGPSAQDFARIGRAADSVKIMAYDHAWANSEPGPIAPNAWVERVSAYALTRIPKEKLELGIAGYGYDWAERPARSLTWAGWAPFDADAEDCALSGERVAGKRRFSGANAFRQKKALAERLGLRGIALWYVGSEDPAVWGEP